MVAPHGRVERLEFYDQCQGITYYPDKETYECLMREVSAWRYQPDGGCPRTYYNDDSIELTMPRGDQPSVVSSGGCGA
jgi:hypothetical protein